MEFIGSYNNQNLRLTGSVGVINPILTCRLLLWVWNPPY